MFAAPLPIERIFELADEPTFVNEVASLYDKLDCEVASRQPVCINRGLCCKFAEYDHSLYVTPVELAYFVARADQAILADSGNGQCPYHRGGICTTRVARPGGCRVFFCDPAAQSWQPDASEGLLHQLKTLHTRYDIAYAYVEWLSALSALRDHRRETKRGSVRPD